MALGVVAVVSLPWVPVLQHHAPKMRENCIPLTSVPCGKKKKMEASSTNKFIFHASILLYINTWLLRRKEP